MTGDLTTDVKVGPNQCTQELGAVNIRGYLNIDYIVNSE